MKKLLVFLCAAILLLSGCIDQKTTKNDTSKNDTSKNDTLRNDIVVNGSSISVDYVGSIEGGKVYVTTIESVAKQNNIYVRAKKYEPVKFTVGSGKALKGFDKGVIGMKVGETKTLIIRPDEGYGFTDPSKILVLPILQNIPAKANLSRVIEVPADQFNSDFGKHSVGDIVQIPNSNINMTIKSIGTNVSLEYNLNIGDKIIQKGAPWNQTVLSIDDNNITVKLDVKQNDVVVLLPDAMWNTTVIGLNDTDIMLRHNPIPDKHISSTFGDLNVHFNETSIILDQNNMLAGKTLIFNVTLRSIN